VTVLFTDVEGSTELRQRRGDAVADEILRVHEELVRRALREHGGEPVVFLGDGFMAGFRSAVDAVACAVAIQRGLEEHRRREPDRRVRVRIGLHAGDVTVRGGTLFGQAVHAAARVTAEAAGEQILASSAVRELAADGGAPPFVDRGLFWLKGFPHRWRLYEVAWRTAEGPVPAPAPAAATPLVEREQERADLRRAVRSALGGEGSVVLVSGEAGVGKSRLVGEVAAEAEAWGMAVLVGSCVEMEGASPYLPFVEILEEALLGPRSLEGFRVAVGDAASELARIVPALARALPDVGPPLDLPPEQARRYLWVSVEEFLARAARHRPLLLVLEDLHWADASTLQLIQHLAPVLPTVPILLVGTYRDVEVGPALAATIAELTRRRLVGRIALRRLSRAGVGALLGAMAGHEPPEGLVRLIHGETDGNPFFVEEVFSHLVESGRLLDGDGGFRPDLRLDELDVPESVRLAVGARLARLSGPGREVLGAAAVLGRTFDPSLVERVAGLPADAVFDALDEAERVHLVGPSHPQGARLSFSHELIRQTLLAETPTLRRQRLHARAAAALEETYPDDLEAHAADLAHHLSRSGPGTDPARLVRFLRIAGDRAMQAAAFEGALAHYEDALALLPEEDAAARADLLERQAMALRSVGRWDEALRAMDGALGLYEALGRSEAVGGLCWAMVYQLAWAARFEEAIALAQRGLAALGDLPNADRARLASAAAWVLGLAGDHDAAAAMFASARELASALTQPRALADVLHMETINHMGYAEFALGVDTGLGAAAVFEAEGDLWDLTSVLAFAGYQATTIRRTRLGAELTDRAAPLAERLGHLGARFMVLADRVRREGVMAGDLGLVERVADAMIEVCEQGGLPWLYVGHLYLGMAAHWRGDRDLAEERLRRARELEAPGAFAGQSASLLAMHLALAGRGEEVPAILRELEPAFPQPGRPASLGAWNALFGLTEALALAGRADEAAALGPRIEEALGLGEEWLTFDCRLTSTRAGIAAAAGGRLDAAERHFERAARLAEGNAIERADVLRHHGAMLVRTGRAADLEGGRGMLRRAAQAYRAMGMPRHAAIAEGLLGEGAA
jgi:class 3 adenylate cyclase/tetratricopeptide (TPR) repeat protein